jgi:hypothetical protein
MRNYIVSLLLAPLIALAGCAAGVNDALAGAYAAYDAAASAEIAYKASGAADPKVVADVDALRRPAFAALHAASVVAQAGGKPDLVAVDAAIAALTAYEAAKNVQ